MSRRHRAGRFAVLVPAVALALGLAGAGTATAQRHPTLERGLAAAKSFEVGELDHINLFTGNVVVTLPIGPTYKVGGLLSYGLTLVSNTKVWDFRTRISTDQTFTQSAADRIRMNAGFGWLLLLGGQLIPPEDPGNPASKWILLTPDGAEHAFYDVLHESERDQTTGGVRYTRDGSYLRLRSRQSGPTVGESQCPKQNRMRSGHVFEPASAMSKRESTQRCLREPAKRRSTCRSCWIC